MESMTKDIWMNLSEKKKEEYKLLFGKPLLNKVKLGMGSFEYATLIVGGIGLMITIDSLLINMELLDEYLFTSIAFIGLVMQMIFGIIMEFQESKWIKENVRDE